MERQRNGIFISYRRSDAAATTTAITQMLRERFGARLFHDVTGILPGSPFPDALRQALDEASVVLVLIGSGWLSATNAFHQRRIDFPDDWVHIELSTALASPEVTVIPVLIDDAPMPPAEALPPALATLAIRNAVRVRHDSWDQTMRPLLDRIQQILVPNAVPDVERHSEITLDIVRRAVAETFATRAPAGQVLLATLDELSRLLADKSSMTKDLPPTLELLLNRLLGRSVVVVASYLREFFRESYGVSTTTGEWLGYALEREHFRYGYRYHCCVLVLPDRNGSVASAHAADTVEWDFYGMPSNDGLPYVASVGVRGVGKEFGVIRDSFPSQIPAEFRDSGGSKPT